MFIYTIITIYTIICVNIGNSCRLDQRHGFGGDAPA